MRSGLIKSLTKGVPRRNRTCALVMPGFSFATAAGGSMCPCCVSSLRGEIFSLSAHEASRATQSNNKSLEITNELTYLSEAVLSLTLHQPPRAPVMPTGPKDQPQNHGQQASNDKQDE